MASIQVKEGRSGKIYYVVVSHAGNHKWIKAGTLADAKVLKKKIESLAHSERFEKLGLSRVDKRIDVLSQEYIDNAKLRTSPNTVKRYKGILNTFLTFVQMFHPALRYASQIKPDTIESYQRHRLESVELKQRTEVNNPCSRTRKLLPKPQTVNYEVGALRSVLSWAKEREFISSVPTKTVKPLRVQPKKEVRILSPDECKHFLSTARKMSKSDERMKIYVHAFTFLLNTGLRSGELCNLTWDDVDLETGLIKIRPKEGWTPKSYSREFFLNKTCLDVLHKLGPKEGYVFRNLSGGHLDNDDLRTTLIRVARVAGFHNFTRVHDLRHTFNSIMQMNGVDPATMGRILGHKDIETTMIYTHQTQQHLKKSIETINIR